MAVTKKIEIDGKEVTFKASAAVPRLYRIKFGRDIYKDLRQLEKSVGENDEDNSNLDLFSLEMFEDLAWLMARHADPANVPDSPEEFLDQVQHLLYLSDPAPADRTVGSERADGGGIQKKPRKSEREMTTPLFLLRCVQLGISIADLDLLTIGLVNDMFTERQNDDYPYKELASQEDFDRF